MKKNENSDTSRGQEQNQNNETNFNKNNHYYSGDIFFFLRNLHQTWLDKSNKNKKISFDTDDLLNIAEFVGEKKLNSSDLGKIIESEYFSAYDLMPFDRRAVYSYLNRDIFSHYELINECIKESVNFDYNPQRHKELITMALNYFRRIEYDVSLFLKIISFDRENSYLDSKFLNSVSEKLNKFVECSINKIKKRLYYIQEFPYCWVYVEDLDNKISSAVRKEDYEEAEKLRLKKEEIINSALERLAK